MGFGRKTPERPEMPPKLPKITPVHTHRYYVGDTRHEDTCTCATGRNHTTPKATKTVEGPDNA